MHTHWLQGPTPTSTMRVRKTSSVPVLNRDHSVPGGGGGGRGDAGSSPRSDMRGVVAGTTGAGDDVATSAPPPDSGSSCPGTAAPVPAPASPSTPGSTGRPHSLRTMASGPAVTSRTGLLPWKYRGSRRPTAARIRDTPPQKRKAIHQAPTHALHVEWQSGGGGGGGRDQQR